jgi:hypothetical protein
VESEENPWVSWAAIVVPGIGTALSWPLTAGMPFVTRVAIAVATALTIYAVIYLVAGIGKRGGDRRP